MNKKQETSLDVRCPACNASIKYNPKSSKWKCDYCGSVFDDKEINVAENVSEEGRKDS